MGRQSLIVTAIAVSSVLLMSSGAVAGDWEDELPVVQDPVYQYRHYVTVEPDDTLHVLWPDWTDDNDTQVMLASSPDRGQTWVGPQTILLGIVYDNFDLGANADGLHLLFVEYYEHGVNEQRLLFHTKSLDGAQTWTTPVRIGARENIEIIKLVCEPGALLVHAENFDADEDIIYEYLYVSLDGGATWQEKPLLPTETVNHPRFAVRDGVIHMVYGGWLIETNIKYARSDDLGDTWTTPVAVSSGAGPHSQLPQIAIDDNAIHVAWEDDRSGYFNVMYSRSTDGGATWSTDSQLNDTFYGSRVQLLADEEGLHAVWCQYHGTDGWPTSWSSGDYGIVWYKFSADSGQSWSNEFRVSQNEGILPIDLPSMGANYIKLAEFSTGFCGVWQDRRDGNIDLYMRNNVGPGCAGDVDGDGDTDLSDLAELLAAYGTSEGDPEYNADADFDATGVIDLSDLAYLLADYSCGS